MSLLKNLSSLKFKDLSSLKEDFELKSGLKSLLNAQKLNKIKSHLKDKITIHIDDIYRLIDKKQNDQLNNQNVKFDFRVRNYSHDTFKTLIVTPCYDILLRLLHRFSIVLLGAIAGGIIALIVSSLYLRFFSVENNFLLSYIEKQITKTFPEKNIFFDKVLLKWDTKENGFILDVQKLKIDDFDVEKIILKPNITSSIKNNTCVIDNIKIFRPNFAISLIGNEIKNCKISTSEENAIAGISYSIKNILTQNNAIHENTVIQVIDGNIKLIENFNVWKITNVNCEYKTANLYPSKITFNTCAPYTKDSINIKINVTETEDGLTSFLCNFDSINPCLFSHYLEQKYVNKMSHFASYIKGYNVPLTGEISLDVNKKMDIVSGDFNINAGTGSVGLPWFNSNTNSLQIARRIENANFVGQITEKDLKFNTINLCYQDSNIKLTGFNISKNNFLNNGFGEINGTLQLSNIAIAEILSFFPNNILQQEINKFVKDISYLKLNEFQINLNGPVNINNSNIDKKLKFSKCKFKLKDKLLNFGKSFISNSVIIGNLHENGINMQFTGGNYNNFKIKTINAEITPNGIWNAKAHVETTSENIFNSMYKISNKIKNVPLTSLAKGNGNITLKLTGKLNTKSNEQNNINIDVINTSELKENLNILNQYNKHILNKSLNKQNQKQYYDNINNNLKNKINNISKSINHNVINQNFNKNQLIKQNNIINNNTNINESTHSPQDKANNINNNLIVNLKSNKKLTKKQLKAQRLKELRDKKNKKKIKSNVTNHKTFEKNAQTQTNINSTNVNITNTNNINAQTQTTTQNIAPKNTKGINNTQQQINQHSTTDAILNNNELLENIKDFTIVEGEGIINSETNQMKFVWNTKSLTFSLDAKEKNQDLYINFAEDLQKKTGNIVINCNADPKFISNFIKLPYEYCEGKINMLLEGQWKESNETYNMKADLSNLIMNIPLYGKVKNHPGSDFVANITKDGDIINLSSFKLKHPDVQISGKMQINTKTGAIVECALNEFNSKIFKSKLNITNKANSSEIYLVSDNIKLNHLLDTVKFLNNSSKSDQKNSMMYINIGAVDINNLNQLMNVKGFFEFTSQGELKNIECYGNLNKQPTTVILAMNRFKDEKPFVTVSASNAGEVLKVFGVTESVHDGDLKLHISSFDSKTNALEGKFEINDCITKNNFILNKLLTFTAPGGVFTDNLSVGFNYCMGDIAISQDKVTFGLKAVSPTISLNTRGEYNRTSDNIELNGCCLPMKSFYENFANGKAGKIFGANFKMNGSIQAPNISVESLRSINKRELNYLFKDVLNILTEANVELQDNGENDDIDIFAEENYKANNTQLNKENKIVNKIFSNKINNKALEVVNNEVQNIGKLINLEDLNNANIDNRTITNDIICINNENKNDTNMLNDIVNNENTSNIDNIQYYQTENENNTNNQYTKKNKAIQSTQIGTTQTQLTQISSAQATQRASRQTQEETQKQEQLTQATHDEHSSKQITRNTKNKITNDRVNQYNFKKLKMENKFGVKVYKG